METWDRRVPQQLQLLDFPFFLLLHYMSRRVALLRHGTSSKHIIETHGGERERERKKMCGMKKNDFLPFIQRSNTDRKLQAMGPLRVDDTFSEGRSRLYESKCAREVTASWGLRFFFPCTKRKLTERCRRRLGREEPWGTSDDSASTLDLIKLHSLTAAETILYHQVWSHDFKTHTYRLETPGGGELNESSQKTKHERSVEGTGAISPSGKSWTSGSTSTKFKSCKRRKWL